MSEIKEATPERILLKHIKELAENYALAKATGSTKSEHEAYVKLMDLIGVTDY